MKLTITPTGLSAFLLCDDTVTQVASGPWPNGAGGASVEGAVVPKLRYTVQTTPLFRSSYPFITPRYNLVKRWAITVQRTFTTIEDCYLFKNTHAETIPVSGEICEVNNSGTGIITRYLPGAVIESADCVKVIGRSCDFTYTFTAPNPWQSTP